MYKEKAKYKNGILYLKLTGEFPKENLHKYDNAFSPLMELCRKHSCNKAIMDATELSVYLETLELFKVASDLAKLAKSNLHLALVVREDNVDKFFEDVAVNRGAVFQIFTSLKAAEDWLGSSQ